MVSAEQAGADVPVFEPEADPATVVPDDAVVLGGVVGFEVVPLLVTLGFELVVEEPGAGVVVALGVGEPTGVALPDDVTGAGGVLGAAGAWLPQAARKIPRLRIGAVTVLVVRTRVNTAHLTHG
jgi:hypothetical protein